MSPSVSPVKDVDPPSSSTHFFHQIKYWMGKIVTAFLQISSDLYQLLTKVEHAAIPVIKFTQNPPLTTPIKSPLATEIQSPLALPFPDNDELEMDLFIDLDEKKPAPSQKRLSLQLTPGTATKDRIFENYLKSIGFKDISEFLQKGIFFDLDGKSIDAPNVENLTGEYKAEWKIDRDESLHITDPFKLSFQGGFKKGAFHGKGILAKENEMGTFFPILDGQFDDDAFISGLAVSTDGYIEGTFKKGYRSGKGTIRYFKMNDPNDLTTSHMEYHGEFNQCIPDGKGKAFIINLNGIRLLAQGIFKNGILVKGCYHEDDGRIYKGEWFANKEDLTHSFKGCLTNHKNHSSYDGEIQNGIFQGQGKYTIRQFCEYDDVYVDGKGSILHIHKNTFIDYTCIGEFNNGKLYNGEQKVEWEDGKQGIQICKNGTIVESIITTPDGCKYQGIFDKYVLTGNGKVYTPPDGLEAYSGDLVCGIPHGYGTMTRGGEEETGEFIWGHLRTYP